LADTNAELAGTNHAALSTGREASIARARRMKSGVPPLLDGPYSDRKGFDVKRTFCSAEEPSYSAMITSISSSTRKSGFDSAVTPINVLGDGRVQGNGNVLS
jgi:hypothetical protein